MKFKRCFHTHGPLEGSGSSTTGSEEEGPGSTVGTSVLGDRVGASVLGDRVGASVASPLGDPGLGTSVSGRISLREELLRSPSQATLPWA